MNKVEFRKAINLPAVVAVVPVGLVALGLADMNYEVIEMVRDFVLVVPFCCIRLIFVKNYVKYVFFKSQIV